MMKYPALGTPCKIPAPVDGRDPPVLAGFPRKTTRLFSILIAFIRFILLAYPSRTTESTLSLKYLQ